jgi:hypothetical protein
LELGLRKADRHMTLAVMGKGALGRKGGLRGSRTSPDPERDHEEYHRSNTDGDAYDHRCRVIRGRRRRRRSGSHDRDECFMRTVWGALSVWRHGMSVIIMIVYWELGLCRRDAAIGSTEEVENVKGRSWEAMAAVVEAQREIQGPEERG